MYITVTKKADILQSQFCPVFTLEPEGEKPQLESRTGERLEITHEWVLKNSNED